MAAASPSRRRRLLLLEIVTSSPARNQRAAWFPFFKGLAQGAGCRALWICVGARFGSSEGARPGKAGLDLCAADREALLRRFAGFAPTHALANEPVGPGWERLLRKSAPGCVFVTTEGEGRETRARWLSGLLGIPARGNPYLVGTVEPDYDAIMLNALAGECRPFLAILGGVSCGYRAGLSRNPYFRGVDLSGCRYRHGCSFCSAPRRPMSSLKGDPVGLARAQFAAVLRTAGAGGRNCGRFEVRDARLFARISDFFGMIFKLRLPPAEFFFAPRMDGLLRAGPELERLLPEIAARGHRLTLFRMVVEHFSPAENARFNKGLSPERIDRALALAARLRKDHPGAFDCADTTGYIAFTPWTTLDDLERSLRGGIERGFVPNGSWLYAALELQRGTPIAALASREGGVVRSRYDDAAMTYNMDNERRPRQGLLPWRFKDRRVAVACGIIVRVCALSLRAVFPDATFAGDPLYSWIEDFVDRMRLDMKRPDLFAAELVQAMRGARPPWRRKDLIRRAFGRLRRRS
ncbi:MAG: hypothetical protein HY748_06560 [Elusimicrobia bacterium]|nr:hypothetical protein [Elusimicrobiota bacterium]